MKMVLVRISIAVLIICMLIVSPGTQATVFINEVFMNPPDSTDSVYEFIELGGTPGRKLDGYAIAVLNGTQEKYYPLDSIPPIPVLFPEIDEFFSLDGLTLGSNGILVLGIESSFWYPTCLSDSNFTRWNNIWNGGLDTPGKISNDGSTTIILIRNRPGRTEARPTDSNGLRWGKEIAHDAELITPVEGQDQWGDGSLDKGQGDGMEPEGNTLDLTGLSNSDLTDDLEVVDEVSYEDGQGWEYDTDGRHVDDGSTQPGLPYRHVHALDDPSNFSPDAISRVDYRTKGDGWAPSTGGSGEMSNGNNWQDTATEQWIRGESIESSLEFFYLNDSNLDPDAVQPYFTHVPLWLDDAIGQEYDFSTTETYQIMAGRINPLAVPFIPGDTDRDGDCDADDISKIAAVFGDDDWIFSNSLPDAPEGDEVDPSTQTKPWDVDATGDNGIEPSDLQWTLNFQGDTTGQIVGIKYDSDIIPAATGVVLNSNAGTECTVTTSVNVPSGRTLSTLIVGDIVEITVEGQVTAGANNTVGEKNGIMQFVHDVNIVPNGVVKVVSVEPLGSFNTTRASLQQKQGTDGDLGMDLINGFSTSFAEGLSGATQLYRITLEAVCTGSADVTIQPAEDAKFTASTSGGLKIGHTDSNGNPASSVPASSLSITSLAPPGDFDDNDDEDLADLTIFMDAWLGNNSPTANWDPDCDISDPWGVIDMADYSVFAEYWQRGCEN